MFRAYEPERDRLVAIKLFRLDLPPERVHQLVTEFDLLIVAGLDHPVIAAPLSAGIDGVTAYLAQEYVAAESLDVVTRGGDPTSGADALRIAGRLADALDHAADLQVVHGALHPRDVLMSADELRLVGLGVARALERVGVTAPVRRPYTAPERIGGGAWDRRADVFSLAAVTYELVCGRRLSGSGEQAAAAISETSTTGNVAALRDAFARALDDDMARRFPTASDFADALGAAFADRPAKVSRLVRRNPPRAAAAPRLPLDESEAADLALRAPEPARFDEIEAPMPLADVAAAPPDGADVAVSAAAPADRADLDLAEPAGRPESAAAGGSLGLSGSPGSFLADTAPEPSSLSLVWPLALAAIVGAALGFGAGYAVAIRDRPVVAADTTPGAAPSAPAVAAPSVVSEPPAGAVESRPLPPVRSTPSAPAVVAPAPAPAPARPAVPPAPLFAGRVQVRTTPPGARVFVDGKIGGETPITVRDLARGPHQVRLVREGYTTVERRIVITAAQPAVMLTVPMTRTPPPAPPASTRTEAPLVIESKPPGASVFLDGRQVGTTPLTMPQVQVGAHSVRLALDGYRPWTSPVQVSGVEPNRVTASLER